MSELPPTEALQELVRLQKEQNDRLEKLADSIEYLEKNTKDNRRPWTRVRTQIDIAFWIFVGLPLLILAITLLTGGCGLLSALSQ